MKKNIYTLYFHIFPIMYVYKNSKEYWHITLHNHFTTSYGGKIIIQKNQEIKIDNKGNPWRKRAEVSFNSKNYIFRPGHYEDDEKTITMIDQKIYTNNEFECSLNKLRRFQERSDVYKFELNENSPEFEILMLVFLSTQYRGWRSLF